MRRSLYLEFCSLPFQGGKHLISVAGLLISLFFSFDGVSNLSFFWS